MDKKETMTAAARNAMVHVLKLTGEDKVLIVTDVHTRGIGEAFIAAAESCGCEMRVYSLPEESRPLAEIPDDLNVMLEGKTVVVNAFKGFSDETPFRVKWVLKVMESKKVRLGHSPGITESMMTSGPMNVDYAAMVSFAEKAMDAFKGVRSVHITAPGGTDLTLDIEDRDFRTDVRLTADEVGCNLPCGEIFCGPVETAGDGVLVVDGSVGDVGTLPVPVRITLKGGRIEKVESDDEKLVSRVKELTGVDEEAKVIGELGIGINPGARLTGNLLEDEKAFRTAHIAFGNNEDFPGGQNRSKTHRDFLFNRPTFEATYKDGSKRTLIRDGDFTI